MGRVHVLASSSHNNKIAAAMVFRCVLFGALQKAGSERAGVSDVHWGWE
jgi:hypothetical protein